MKRMGALLVVGAFALAGCGKKDESKTETKDKPGKVEPGKDKKVVHGKVEGPGTGGGAKNAAGSKDSKPGSGKPAGDDELVARGQYLANLGGCAGCHTGFGPTGPAIDKMWAGGLKVTEKGFGTWISPNITPHPETGIGKWTDEQIAASIREGKHPDGSQLAPIMPWPLYNRLTDDDTKALVAFLRTLPQIDNKVERGDLKMPRLPEMKPANAPVGDDPIAKGEYYATIMHCVMCHTPMTEKGPDMANAFAGGFVMEQPPEFAAKGSGTLVTPNITPHPENGMGADRSRRREAA